MATKIKIGHASRGDLGIIGNAGDQDGFEVCIKDDFDILSKKYNVVLRPKTSTLANKSATACEAGCANNNIGYSQSSRNTLYTYAKAVGYDLSKVSTKCNTDCSAFMTICAIAGGSKIDYGTNAPTTTTMRTRFKQSGDYTVLTDSKHTKQTDYLKRGDILVCEGSHTVMVLENGTSVSDDAETTQEEPIISGGITTTVKITVRSIELSLDTVENTKATITIKALEQKTGAAATALSANKVDKYTWSYRLENLSNGTIVNKELPIKSGTYKLNLNNLTKDTAYTLQVFALKAGQPSFCSQKILFITNIDNTSKELVNRVFTGDSVKAVSKIYIKVKDKFYPAVIHKM